MTAALKIGRAEPEGRGFGELRGGHLGVRVATTEGRDRCRAGAALAGFL